MYSCAVAFIFKAAQDTNPDQFNLKHFVQTFDCLKGDKFGSYLPQEYFRRIGFHTLRVLIVAYGLILVPGFLEALSMFFRSLVYPFHIF